MVILIPRLFNASPQGKRLSITVKQTSLSQKPGSVIQRAFGKRVLVKVDNIRRIILYHVIQVLYTNIDLTLVNSLHGLLNCEIGGLDCHVIATKYRKCVHCIHM